MIAGVKLSSLISDVGTKRLQTERFICVQCAVKLGVSYCGEDGHFSLTWVR